MISEQIGTHKPVHKEVLVNRFSEKWAIFVDWGRIPRKRVVGGADTYSISLALLC